jgi:predicted porin
MKYLPIAAAALGVVWGQAALAESTDASGVGALQPATPVVSTSGDWSGLYAGLQVGNLDVDGTGATDGDDVNYGVHFGYNYDLGDWVLGGEFDYDTGDVNLAGAATVESMARLKLRAGYDLGKSLIYLTAGAARMDTTLGNETGPFGGVGLTYAVTPQWLIGGEVLYHEFDDIGGFGVGADVTSVTLRTSFRF